MFFKIEHSVRFGIQHFHMNQTLFVDVIRIDIGGNGVQGVFIRLFDFFDSELAVIKWNEFTGVFQNIKRNIKQCVIGHRTERIESEFEIGQSFNAVQRRLHGNEIGRRVQYDRVGLHLSGDVWTETEFIF
mgnify:CR=1 FL=1